MTRNHFLIRGAGSLDMPLRVLDLMALQGAAVFRAAIQKDGDEYCVSVDACVGRPQLILEKIRSMTLVSSVEQTI